jgi:hypothetical protein
MSIKERPGWPFFLCPLEYFSLVWYDTQQRRPNRPTDLLKTRFSVMAVTVSAYAFSFGWSRFYGCGYFAWEKDKGGL